MLAFIIAVAAGFATPHIEGSVGKAVVSTMADHVELQSGEHRLVAFLVAMLVAGIVIALTGGGSPFWVILGGGIGVFLARLSDAGRAIYQSRSRSED